ncbi:MAG: DVUA0089 family protein, partial [Pirellulales bacterium]
MPTFPGSEDEPGHRQIQAESHGAGVGVTPVVPNAISFTSYSFPPTIGTDLQGNPLLNLITEEEKQITREVFEIYASLAGIEFQETQTGGLRIAKGDIAAVDPGSAGFVPGISGALVVLDAATYNQSNRAFGDGFTGTMFHEVGHSIGLGHAYDLPSIMGSPGPPGAVLPGDHDIVHLQRIHRPDATDIDLYEFDVAAPGEFTAEITAERLGPTSLLNSVLTLFDEEGEVIARNDDYFSNDSFIGIHLEAGKYFVGVTSTGNIDYNPRIADSGFGGTTDGDYDLTLGFDTGGNGALADADGTKLDGDADGSPGGVFQFWFEVSDYTIFVDKNADTVANQVDGTGTLSDPVDTISNPQAAAQAAFDLAANRIIVPVDGGSAFRHGDRFVIDDTINSPLTFTFDDGSGGVSSPSILIDPDPNTLALRIFNAIDAEITATNLTGITVTRDAVNTLRVIELSFPASLDVSAAPGLVNAPNIVRIVGNGGLDNDLDTRGDNRPYLIGEHHQSGLALADGREFLVPQGTTVMVDGGTLFKMRKANLDAGTSSLGADRSSGAIQLLGTPAQPVLLRSFHNDAVGGNSDGVGPAPQPGDFGGVVFRSDSDLESQVIFLNQVYQADIEHGGGKVFVDSVESAFSPVYMDDARPTIAYSWITSSENSAISANPNSFDDSLGRIGPDIHGNTLLNNTVNGLFIRIETGTTLEKLNVTGRWDDTDVTHVLTENLLIAGAPGGPLVSREIQKISITGGTPTTGTFDLSFTDQFGVTDIAPGIAYNAPASVRTNKIVRLSAPGATSGTFQLDFQGDATPAALNFNATAGDIQVALETLPSIDPGDVMVTGGPLNVAPVTIEYTGQYLGDDTIATGDLSVVGSTVTPATPTVTNVAEVVIPVQERLESLSNILAGDVIVTGGPLNVADVTVAFVGNFGSNDLPEMTAFIGSLNAGTPSVTTDSDGNLSGRTSGRLAIDAGVVVKLAEARIEAERGASNLIAEGTRNRPVIFTCVADDRFGGSGTFDVSGGGASQGTRGDWSGLMFNHVSSGSIDRALISFAGGASSIEGISASFNPIEVHQARLRLTNSIIEQNAGISAGSTRKGRGANAATTIFVRGSQPIVVNNIIQDNTGSVINID